MVAAEAQGDTELSAAEPHRHMGQSESDCCSKSDTRDNILILHKVHLLTLGQNLVVLKRPILDMCSLFLSKQRLQTPDSWVPHLFDTSPAGYSSVHD